MKYKKLLLIFLSVFIIGIATAGSLLVSTKETLIEESYINVLKEDNLGFVDNKSNLKATEIMCDNEHICFKLEGNKIKRNNWLRIESTVCEQRELNGTCLLIRDRTDEEILLILDSAIENELSNLADAQLSRRNNAKQSERIGEINYNISPIKE